MVSKFDLDPFRKELAGLYALAKLQMDKAERRKQIAALCIKKIKDASQMTHDNITRIQKEKRQPTKDEMIFFEFLEQISEDSRTSYEELLAISQKNKDFLVYLNELIKKIDSCFERITEKKEISYTERNLVQNNRKKVNALSEKAAKYDAFLELIEEDVMKTVDRMLIGLS